MKCPRCEMMTSDSKDNCPRCGLDLAEVRRRYALKDRQKKRATTVDFKDLAEAIDGVLEKTKKSTFRSVKTAVSTNKNSLQASNTNMQEVLPTPNVRNTSRTDSSFLQNINLDSKSTEQNKLERSKSSLLDSLDLDKVQSQIKSKSIFEPITEAPLQKEPSAKPDRTRTTITNISGIDLSPPPKVARPKLPSEPKPNIAFDREKTTMFKVQDIQAALSQLEQKLIDEDIQQDILPPLPKAPKMEPLPQEMAKAPHLLTPQQPSKMPPTVMPPSAQPPVTQPPVVEQPIAQPSTPKTITTKSLAPQDKAKSLDELLEELGSSEKSEEISYKKYSVEQATNDEDVDFDELFKQLEKGKNSDVKADGDFCSVEFVSASETPALDGSAVPPKREDFDALISGLQNTKIEKKTRRGAKSLQKNSKTAEQTSQKETEPAVTSSSDSQGVSLEELAKKFASEEIDELESGSIWQKCAESLDENLHLAEDVSFLEICSHAVDQNVLLMFEMTEKEWGISPKKKKSKKQKKTLVSKKKGIKIKSNLESAFAEYEQAEEKIKERKKNFKEIMKQEQEEATLKAVAPLWKRFIAFTVDILIVLTATLFLAWVHIIPEDVQVRLSYMDQAGLHAGLPYLADLLMTFSILWIVINTIFMGSWSQSLGGRLLNLRLTDDNGFYLDYKHALLRNLCQITTLMTLGLGVLLALSKKKKTLHDRIARTMVLRY